MNQIGFRQSSCGFLTPTNCLRHTSVLGQGHTIGVNMRTRELDHATIEVANTTDMSGKATADEINRGLRIGKGENVRLIACSTIWSLMVTGLFLSLAATPAPAEEDHDRHGGREDNDKGIHAEIAALQAQVTSLQSTVSGLQGQVSALQTANTVQQNQITSLQTNNAKLQNQVNGLQTSDTTLQTQLAAVQSNPALALGPFVSVDPNPEIGVVGPNIIFSGANIHIVSGSRSTFDNDNARGLGNLIIGYDDDPQNLFCGPRGRSPSPARRPRWFTQLGHRRRQQVHEVRFRRNCGR